MRKPTVTQLIMLDVRDKLSHVSHASTRKQYASHAKAYVKFCRERYGAKSFDACSQYIQNYCDYLCGQGYSASTVHTYLAAICTVWNIKLDTIQKPIRHTADYTRGRNTETKSTTSDLNDPKWSYLVDFQRVVGIRRKELRRLKGGDFAYDESGYPCVIVRKGKGGKMQYQRIDPEQEEFIRKYFDGCDFDQPIFPGELFNNDLNLHTLRAECAKKYYFKTLERVKADPLYATQLEREICARWKLYNILYDSLITSYPHNKDLIDSIVNVITEALYTNSLTLRVRKSNISTADVKNHLLKLTYFHIEYVCSCFENTNISDIKYINAYICTALYNAVENMDSEIMNDVLSDMGL